MKIQSAIAIYFLFWGMSAFVVLPFEARGRKADAPTVAGQAFGAPAEFRPWRVVARTTLVSTALYGVFYLNYVFGWVTPAMLGMY